MIYKSTATFRWGRMSSRRSRWQPVVRSTGLIGGSVFLGFSLDLRCCRAHAIQSCRHHCLLFDAEKRPGRHSLPQPATIPLLIESHRTNWDWVEAGCLGVNVCTALVAADGAVMNAACGVANDLTHQLHSRTLKLAASTIWLRVRETRLYEETTIYGHKRLVRVHDKNLTGPYGLYDSALVLQSYCTCNRP